MLTLTWFRQQTGTKMVFQSSRHFEKRWNKKVLDQADENSLKRFEMQKFVVCMSLSTKSELTEKLGRQMTSEICVSTRTRWNILKIKSQVRSLKCSVKNKPTKRRCKNLMSNLNSKKKNFKSETRHLKTAKGSKLELLSR